MKRKWFLVLGVFLTALVFAGSSAAQSEKSYQADRFDVDIEAQAGGEILVTERVTFDFSGGPFTFVFREIPTNLTDGITILRAGVDGRGYTAGSGPGQVELEGGNPLRVTWHMEPTWDSRHTFELTYRAAGVVRQSQGSDLLIWQPLPDAYEYAIGSSTVTIDYPVEAGLVAPASVSVGRATVESAPGRSIFHSEQLRPSEALIVNLAFEPGSLIAQPPRWQQREQARQAQLARQKELAWLWFASSGLLLVAGCAAAVLAWRPSRRQRTGPSGTLYEPPDDLPPALAGALTASNPSPTWPHALGTLFDLAGRGALQITELADKKWYSSSDFTLTLRERLPGLLPHEKGLLALLFETKKGPVEQIRLSELNKQISNRRWKGFLAPLEDEFEEAGFISQARQKKHRQITWIGLAIFVAAAIGLLSVPLLLYRPFGLWPMAIPIALFVVAFAFIIAGQAIDILSDEGARKAVEWRRFSRYLRDITRQKAAITRPDMFEIYLPYAAAFGLLESWVKGFKKRGLENPPPYFLSLSRGGADSMAAFVVLAATSSSSGGSAAGAAAAAGAGAAAAGGGASGAG